MSIAATKWVFEQQGIPISTRGVLLVIADMVNRKGEAWPSLTTVAKRCELSHRMVQRHIATALKLGLIKVTHDTGKSSTYSFPTHDTGVVTTDMSPTTLVSYSHDTDDVTPPYRNRKGTVNTTSRGGNKKNKWIEVVKQVAEFCGGQPLTKQHIETIQEKYGHLDLLDQALAFESFHTEKHNKSKYRTFATYARFSSTWLSRAEQETQRNGITQQRVQKNSRGKVVKRIPKPGEPSPLH